MAVLPDDFVLGLTGGGAAADVAALRDLGIQAHAFTLDWPALQPDGRGRLQPAALAGYDRLADALAEAGIRAFVTLTGALPPRLGWAARDTVYRFVDFACLAANRLGDRVGDFLLVDAPARTAWGQGADLPRALHHLVVAERLGLAALRRESGAWRLGVVRDLRPVEPADDSMAAADAAHLLDAWWNRAFLEPRYPDEVAPAVADLVGDGDGGERKADFVLMDYSGRQTARIAADHPAGAEPAGPPPGARLSKAGEDWQPAALTALVSQLEDAPLFIACGSASADDHEQIDYLAEHLDAAAAARGFLVRSLDELVRVDPPDPARRPRPAFGWLARVAAERRV